MNLRLLSDALHAYTPLVNAIIVILVVLWLGAPPWAAMAVGFVAMDLERIRRAVRSKT